MECSMASALFQPIQLRSLTLENRIMISPMCQHSAVDGSANDWHMIHLGHLAFGGAGILFVEATAVNSLSDDEATAAVDYMLEKAGVH
jgi:2,4-dienoyl-CoA reductase-like NADH-dependent reductase (Old Yellow Enzyme family)